MRIESISSGSSIGYNSKAIKKLLSSQIEEINKSTSLVIKNLYDKDAGNKQSYHKNSKQFKSHNSIFHIPGIDEEMYVSYIYTNTNEVLEELERLIFNTSVGISLSEYYFLLKDENNIEVGFDSRNFSGTFRPSKMNIKDSKIFLQGNKTLILMASTLIHELTHLMDINNIKNSANLRYLTTADLEINAFANEYSFFKQGNYLTNIEFDGLTHTAKLLLDGAYNYDVNKSIDSKRYLLDILTDIGYEVDYLNSIYLD